MLTGSVTQLQKIWLSDEKFGDTAAGTGTSLRREIETLFRSRRFIAGWVAVAVSAVSAYNYGTRPLYEAVAVVSMDRASAPTLRVPGTRMNSGARPPSSTRSNCSSRPNSRVTPSPTRSRSWLRSSKRARLGTGISVSSKKLALS